MSTELILIEKTPEKKLKSLEANLSNRNFARKQQEQFFLGFFMKLY